MSESIDYKALLAKYMEYVCDCEGTDFVTGRDYAHSFGSGPIAEQFTHEEWVELQTLPPCVCGKEDRY
jgi:hypothetical protein